MRRPRHFGRPVFAALLLSGAVAFSCSDSDATDGPSACSTGPDYPDDVVFPYEDGAAEYPECKPRCGTNAPSTLKALPSGSCSKEGERCAALLNYYCGSQSELAARVDRMRCSCSNGAWQCVIASKGGGACGRDPDGGEVPVMHY